MVDRVFVHIGLPKTATSYLQTIIWSNREALRARGIVVPGEERRDHLWSSRVVREQRSVQRAPEREQTAWARLQEELATSEGTGLVSHEFFAAASAEQAAAMVDALAPAEVHLVVTAREPLGLFTASWQESLKNGSATPMPEYATKVSTKPTKIWNWRTLDLRLVLERWTVAVPPERVHVLVLDPAADRDDVWHRFAGIVGFDSEGIDLSGSFPNSSMGVAEAETLRRINTRLDRLRPGVRQGRLHPFLPRRRAAGPARRESASCLSRTRSRSAARAVRTPSPTSGARRSTWSATSICCWSPRSSSRAAAPCRSPTPRWPTWPSAWSRRCSADVRELRQRPVVEEPPPPPPPTWRSRLRGVLRRG